MPKSPSLRLVASQAVILGVDLVLKSSHMKNFVSKKLLFVLLGMSLVSIACVFPYVLTIQGDIFAQIAQPLWLILLVQFIQSAILFSAVIYCGLFFTKKIGFKLPLLEALTEKGDARIVFKDIAGKSALLGVLTAGIIYVLDILFTSLGAGITTHASYAPVWQKLLAATYGGVTEEILMRLFVMAFFIWIGMKLWKQAKPTKTNIIIAIVLAAVIFGLGHLPLTASLTALTPLIVLRAVVLNGVGGIIFGWLFWKKGLESAMFAHFTTDIVLLSILPLVF